MKLQIIEVFYGNSCFYEFPQSETRLIVPISNTTTNGDLKDQLLRDARCYLPEDCKYDQCDIEQAINEYFADKPAEEQPFSDLEEQDEDDVDDFFSAIYVIEPAQE